MKIIINIKRNIILLIITLIAATGVFIACEKIGDKNQEIYDSQKSYNEITDYDAYIDSLEAKTGIDISKISQLEGIAIFAEKNIKIIDIAEKALSAKGNLTQEKLIQIQSLVEDIQVAYNTGDHEKVLILYESLCAICMTIDGFIFDINEYGLQTVTYDPDKMPITIPAAQMEFEKLQAVQLEKDILSISPTFSKLPTETRKEVIACALYLKMNNDRAKAPPTSCKSQAKSSLTWTLTGLTAAYIAGAALCAGTFLAIIACEIVAYSGYVSGCAMAIDLYNARVQLCNTQGYY